MTERQLLESTYHDHATIHRRTAIKDALTKQTHQGEAIIAADVLCALSRDKSGGLLMSGGVGRIGSSYTLFCAPDAPLQAGDRLVVTTAMGQAFSLWAGQPFLYVTHQEVPLTTEGRP